MDEVRIYNRALSAAEIEQLYQLAQISNTPTIEVSVNDEDYCGGTVSPSGSVTVDHGGDQTFKIMADHPYENCGLVDLRINGLSVNWEDLDYQIVGSDLDVTFHSITSDFTILAIYGYYPVPM
jgi:hypothetical protein